jgi:PAS domain S-box-containing protein
LAHFVEFDRYLVPATGTAGRWVATLGAACAIALAYILAAQLGLSLLAKPSDVAVFWPASGLAAGILIAAGWRVGVALVVGVVAGTVAANLMSDRTLSTSILKGICNAGETLLVAWLLERWFGRPFTFGDFRSVVGFFAAAALASAISAVGGAAIMTTFHTAAPFWEAWRMWFLSDAVGIVVVAPLLIELGQLTSQRRSRAEWIEGAGVVVLMVLASMYAVNLPTGTWLSFDSDAIVFPLLLWLAARNQQPFAIAGTFAVSIAVISATTYGLGHFGDVTLPIIERVQGAQVVATMVTAFTLVLSALFAERRRSEAGLKRSEAELKQTNNRLRLALECAELGTWNLQLDTGRFENDVRDRRIHGHGSAAPPKTLAEMRSQVHSDDLSKLDAAFGALSHADGSCRAEYRLAPRTDQERAGRGRWVTLKGTVVRRADGRPEQLLGVTRDITERKLAEEALRTSEERLRRVSDNADVGLIRCSHDWFYLSANPAYAKIVSKPLDQIVGRPMAEVIGAEAVETIRPYVERVLRGEHVVYETEVPYAGPGKRYLHISYTPDTDAAGQIVGWVACVTDITERKHAELILAERNAQLELASKTARVGSFAIDFRTELVNLSPGCAAILGLPESTVEMSRDNIRKRVHPEDLAKFDAARDQVFLKKQREFVAQFRIIRADNAEIRWTLLRGVILYDQDGQPLRVMVGIIDFTERKQAELQLAERNAQLDLAGQIARIGRFTYDHATQQLQISPGFATIYGLPESVVEMSREDWRAMVHPDDLPRLDTVARRALSGRETELVLEFRILRRSEVRWIESRMLISYDDAGKPTRRTGAQIDVTERRRAEDHKGLLVAELDHRVKNTLATVSAVVSQTRQGSSVADFAAALEGRIRSMAATHELLSARRWSGVSLANLVSRELAPYANRNNTEINGPDVALRPEAGQAMAMVIHELATNAAKYGALSTGKGRVSLRWDRRLNGRPRSDLVLEWQEIDGPPVSAPGNPSYGMSTIRDLIPYEFDGTVDLVFAPEGVRCRLKLPADWLSDAPDPHDPSSGAIAGAAGK